MLPTYSYLILFKIDFLTDVFLVVPLSDNLKLLLWIMTESIIKCINIKFTK